MNATTHSRPIRTATVFAVALLFSVVSRPLVAQQPDRSAPPELGSPPELKLPPVQSFRLANGTPVLLMEKHNVPIVQIDLIVPKGTSIETPNEAGLVSLTAAMMKEGAGGLSSIALSDAIDYLGARISVDAALEDFTVQLHTPVSKLDRAFALMKDIVLHPMFPPEELERLRKERLNALVQDYDEPRSVAMTEFNRVLYGEESPYGMRHDGTFGTLRKFTVDDVRSMYSRLFDNPDATIIVVGDVTKESMLPMLDAAFPNWRKMPHMIAAETRSTIRQVSGRTVYFVDKPGAAQSEIRIGRVGVPRQSPDYFPILVMNTILGGSFTSRLNQNLREEHGYTYGAYSFFRFLHQAGPFLALSAVQTAVTDKSLTEFFHELDRIGTVSDEDVDRAKNYLALGYPKDFQTVSEIAARMREMAEFGIPLNYFETYIPSVQAVTKDDVVRVARETIDPSNIAVVVVGDRKVVEAGVEEMKLGPVKNLTVEDVLGAIPDDLKK